MQIIYRHIHNFLTKLSTNFFIKYITSLIATIEGLKIIFRHSWEKRFFRYLSLGVLSTLLSLGVINLNSSVEAQVLNITPAQASVEAKEVSSEALVRAGKKYYLGGKFVQAVSKWQQAEKIFHSRGDILNQSAVLSNLALGYQKLGDREEANRAIENSLNLLNNLDSLKVDSLKAKSKVKSLQAEALNIQGSILFSEGKIQEALNVWKKARENYQKVGNNSGYIRSLLNQSQALRALGLYSRAKTTLEQVHQSLEEQPASLLKAATLLNFGDTLRITGDLQTSQKVLEESLAIAQKLNSPNHIASALLSLGNNAREAESGEVALKYYQRAIAVSKSPITQLYSQLNQLRLLVDMEKWQDAEDVVTKIEPKLRTLTPSRQAIYAKVNFVQSLAKIPGDNQGFLKMAKILGVAIQEAKTIGDLRSQSYALGYLGELYEKTEQLSEAQRLTEQALALAQASRANDITYRWQWQLGRLLKKQNQIEEAIASYSEAVKTLDSIRNDLVAGDVNIQFSFRESVEPVYRELVSLLLQPSTVENSKSLKEKQPINQTSLKKAREVIESLQLAELDNYFREACLTNSPTQIDRIDPQAAIIYPIILPDRLEVILSLPDGTLDHYTKIVPQSDLENTIQKMRRSLRRTSLKKERQAIAQKLYDLLIKPGEAQLQANGIKTLAFVLDGSMKNLPMAALYDGQQYLIEKYNLALTPGLQLLAPRVLENQNLKILAGGLSQSRQGFMSLPGVKTEINQIKSAISSEVLLDQAFTTKSLGKQISKTPFPVVHLATHGQFSSSAKDTFVLTWDNRIDVKQLGELLQKRETSSKNPIELLVLSACQTAQGDKRAALGLAGVAVRSGARSTLASLWSVDDQSTSIFMLEFYKQLAKTNISKAEALRQAQISLLKQREFKHPFYWAPFVLVGSWL